MKQLGIIALVVILIVFGTPLLSVKDNYKNMEYEEIGNEMLANVDSYVGFLETTSNVANNTINFFSETLDYISGTLKTIRDFIKGLFEHETGQTCIPNESTGGFTCGSSEGGGGGSFGGGNR